MKSTVFKYYREEILKIKQVEMAKLLGLSPNYYNMIENGKRGISTELIEKVSRLVNKSMNEVYADIKSHKSTTLKTMLRDELSATAEERKTA